ncbi:MAG: hypothetical protein M0Z94_05560 [Dehalococcoidales bacterium]|nr:hypothetical protein [Dehalococcoidales bacterium]
MADKGYFYRVAEATGTRFWINNPTGSEAEQAIAAGAIGCTTNPAYCATLLEREPAFLRGVIDEVLTTETDADAAAERTYQRAVLRIAGLFRPLYDQSKGRVGYAIIQGDPRHDSDPSFIIAEALRNRAVAANIMAKVPANVAGAEEIDTMVAHDVPMCVTEVLGVGQAAYIWEAYGKAVAKHGKQPVFYVTHITGILDRYLAKVASEQGVAIAPDVLGQAGYAVAREEYRLYRERGYLGAMMIGGALDPTYFTRMVGADMHVTIDWSSAAALLAADGPVEREFEKPLPAGLVGELSEKLADFRRSYDVDALPPAQFADYGPLAFFRGMFLQRYGLLVEELKQRIVSR